MRGRKILRKLGETGNVWQLVQRSGLILAWKEFTEYFF